MKDIMKGENMQVFAYKLEQNLFEIILSCFPDAKISDVSDCYQDILALNADVVFINVSGCEKDALSAIRKFESETKGSDSTRYVYVDDEILENLKKIYESEEGKEKGLWYLQWILMEH